MISPWILSFIVHKMVLTLNLSMEAMSRSLYVASRMSQDLGMSG